MLVGQVGESAAVSRASHRVLWLSQPLEHQRHRHLPLVPVDPCCTALGSREPTAARAAARQPQVGKVVEVARCCVLCLERTAGGRRRAGSAPASSGDRSVDRAAGALAGVGRGGGGGGGSCGALRAEDSRGLLLRRPVEA